MADLKFPNALIFLPHQYMQYPNYYKAIKGMAHSLVLLWRAVTQQLHH